MKKCCSWFEKDFEKVLRVFLCMLTLASCSKTENIFNFDKGNGNTQDKGIYGGKLRVGKHDSVHIPFRQ